MATEAPIFNKFPELPVELRLLVWSHALPDSQTVIITNDNRYERISRAKNAKVRHIDQARATYKLPSLLMVNTEARDVTLETYTPTASKYLQGVPIYLDFNKDTLYIADDSAAASFLAKKKNVNVESLANEKDLESNLRRLAIGGTLIRHNTEQWIKSMPQLSHLIREISWPMDDQNTARMQSTLRSRIETGIAMNSTPKGARELLKITFATKPAMNMTLVS